MSATLTRLPHILRRAAATQPHTTARHGSSPSIGSRRHPEQHSTKRPTAEPPKNPSQYGSPEMVPKVSFREMFHGASPLVKGVVYTMVAVIATAETYTYSIWIWHKLYPSSHPRSETTEEAAS